MEKLGFALVTTARKLKLYFQADTIVVQTDKPLRRVMNNLEAVGQLVLWVIELDEFNILYRPRTVIKAQALANFVAKFTVKEDEDRRPVTWMVWMDGSSNQRTRGVGVVLQSLERDLIECVVCFQFPTTNNEAEYEVVLTSLNLTKWQGLCHSHTQRFTSYCQTH